MQLRLPDELHAQLKAAAAEDDQSVNAEAVAAIADYLARRQTAKVREIAREVAKRDAELLELLAR
jgi:predicted transcriptional regulator